MSNTLGFTRWTVVLDGHSVSESTWCAGTWNDEAAAKSVCDQRNREIRLVTGSTAKRWSVVGH